MLVVYCATHLHQLQYLVSEYLSFPFLVIFKNKFSHLCSASVTNHYSNHLYLFSLRNLGKDKRNRFHSC